MPAAVKQYRVRVPFRWVDPKTGASREFYEVDAVHSASDMPEPEKHLQGVDNNGPLIEEVPATSDASNKEN